MISYGLYSFPFFWAAQWFFFFSSPLPAWVSLSCTSGTLGGNILPAVLCCECTGFSEGIQFFTVTPRCVTSVFVFLLTSCVCLRIVITHRGHISDAQEFKRLYQESSDPPTHLTLQGNFRDSYSYLALTRLYERNDLHTILKEEEKNPSDLKTEMSFTASGAEFLFLFLIYPQTKI